MILIHCCYTGMFTLVSQTIFCVLTVKMMKMMTMETKSCTLGSVLYNVAKMREN